MFYNLIFASKNAIKDIQILTINVINVLQVVIVVTHQKLINVWHVLMNMLWQGINVVLKINPIYKIIHVLKLASKSFIVMRKMFAKVIYINII
jgi:hypothetical protein